MARDHVSPSERCWWLTMPPGDEIFPWWQFQDRCCKAHTEGKVPKAKKTADEPSHGYSSYVSGVVLRYEVALSGLLLTFWFWWWSLTFFGWPLGCSLCIRVVMNAWRRFSPRQLPEMEFRPKLIVLAFAQALLCWLAFLPQQQPCPAVWGTLWMARPPGDLLGLEFGCLHFPLGSSQAFEATTAIDS